MKTYLLTYEHMEVLCKDLVKQMKLHPALAGIESVYGVPRGGVPPAVLIAKLLKLPLAECPHEKSLIVDDIADSGKTLSRFQGRPTAVLFKKPHTKVEPTFFAEETDAWVSFPWEKNESPAEDAVIRVLEVIGEDPSREGLLDTPKRVIKSYSTLFGGYKQSSHEILKTTFEGEGYDQIVLLDNIEFYSTCEHHMLPFFGKAHVAYIPRKRVVGLSKLARLVEVFARRLQIQERLTNQIADALHEALDPHAVGVIMQAKHFCMVARGVQKQEAVMTTSALKGLFKTDTKARTEFLNLIQRNSK